MNSSHDSVEAVNMESVPTTNGKARGRAAGPPGRAASRRGGAQTDPRSRMLAAMLELVGEQGYPSTTVADVIGRAGASRKTFYEHFEDRDACFMAVADEVSSRWVERTAEAAEQGDRDGEAAEIALSELFGAALAEPNGLRVIATEMPAAGRTGLERRDRALTELGEILAGCLGDDSSQERGSLTFRASAGGLLRMAYARVLRGGRVKRPRRADLLDLVPEAARWLTSYASADEPPIRPFAAGDPPPVGGRAPGTLSLGSRASERRGLPRGESTVSRSFVIHSQRERLLDALANLCAAKGYEQVTIPEIVTEAAVSVQAFYEHFSGREDALLVAYELGHRKCLALVERAYEAHDEWPDAVRAGLNAMLDFLASEPSWAHLALVDVPAAGAKAYALARDGLRSYAELLTPGLAHPNGRAIARIAPEASTSAVQELCFLYTARERARELSTLADVVAHIALTPFADGLA